MTATETSPGMTRPLGQSASGLADEDLRRRLRRLLEGGRRPEDLDRLYLGLRGRSRGCPAVQEIGDFIAHRDQREKGMITQTGRDVFTSFDVWSMPMRKLKLELTDFIRAAEANLRLASDGLILQALNSSRQTAAARLKRAIAKLKSDQRPSDAEWAVFSYLGNRFIWRPAFTADQLQTELAGLLVSHHLMDRDDLAQFVTARTFITLHAVTLMHGSAIVLENGERARLFAGYANRDRWIEVKVDIVFHDRGKPIMAPICLFLTDLRAEVHCSPDLLEIPSPIFVDHWDAPLEIGADGRLARLDA
jgi:hypothetical protein